MVTLVPLIVSTPSLPSKFSLHLINLSTTKSFRPPSSSSLRLIKPLAILYLCLNNILLTTDCSHLYEILRPVSLSDKKNPGFRIGLTLLFNNHGQKLGKLSTIWKLFGLSNPHSILCQLHVKSHSVGHAKSQSIGHVKFQLLGT